MFERYTEKARRIIFFARYEASQFGSPYIEVEHLLLGLMREDKGLMESVLPGLAMQTKLRDDVRASIPQREQFNTSVDLPLSHVAKRVLAYGAEEAERLGHKHIGTDHLLLGLMREPSGLDEIFLRYGLNLDQLRRKFAEKTSFRPSLVAGSANALSAVQAQFGELTARLTQEVEPALVYLPPKPE